MTAPTQFRGQNHAGEYLVTVFPATATTAATAEVAFRADQWDTFDAPIKLMAVPAHQVQS